jgi:Zn-dependent protease
MTLSAPIKCFPSIEEAQVAFVLLECHGIPSEVKKSPDNWSYTLYVANQDEERANELIIHLGFTPLPYELELEASSSENPSTPIPSDQMLDEIREAMKSQKKSLVQKLSVLIISLIIFAGMGLLQGPPVNLLLILLVLFIHESGHWLGMKFFGYRDLQMFFIPGFGAAVSGNETTPSARQKAIVSLMGPLPGIIIGVGCGIAYAFVRNNLLSHACGVFVLINGFNLLPFSPLDGGRFLEAVLFTRHPKAEIAFKVLAAGGLAWVAFEWKSVALGIVIYITLASLKNVWTLAKAASHLRKELPQEHSYTSNEIPDALLHRIISHLHDKLPMAQHNARHLAAAAKTVWSRMIIRHCSVRTSIGLTLLYLLFAVPALGLIALTQVSASRQTESVEQVIENAGYNATTSTDLPGNIQIKWKPYEKTYP